MKKLIIVLHNAISSGSLDEVDVLAQRDLVKTACLKLGYQVECMSSAEDPMKVARDIHLRDPDMVFNLVEALWGKGELIYVQAAVLNSLGIPFTGVSLEALFLTTNKLLTKNILRSNNILTADYFTLDQVADLNSRKRYIIKPIWEEGSLGFINNPVFTWKNMDMIAWINSFSKRHYFIEEYIEGREINVSLLAGKNGPEILPIAEIIFSDYFKDKDKILGYKAKWLVDSDEYQETKRAFGRLDSDPELEKKIRDLSLKIWDLFGLTGYARIDFRINKKCEPYILEVNGNPCISPDSGFVASVEEAGYSQKTMIERIINDAR
ncbi:MAG: ATP-grasp domain-containing protein [Candidatus Neomarinimicrobiota bacterium]